MRYRIDELAQAGKTTVRNVRAYQERGLLPPPQRDGRVGYYSAGHLARIRTITALLERGYSMGNIAELLSAWERGGELRDVLGLEMAVTSPLDEDAPTETTLVQLARLFGSLDFTLLGRAKEVGLIDGDGLQLSVPSPKLLQAGAALHRAGIPLPALLEELGRLRAELDTIAQRFVTMVLDHVFNPHGDGLPPREARAALTDTVWKVRPLAGSVVQSVLAQALERHMREALGARLAAAAPAAPSTRSKKVTPKRVKGPRG